MDGTQRMESTATSQPNAGDFFILKSDARRGGKGRDVVFESEKALLTPPRLMLRPKTRGLPPLKEVSRLVYDPSDGALPQDLEGGLSGYWLVAIRLCQLMEAMNFGVFANVLVFYARFGDKAPFFHVWLDSPGEGGGGSATAERSPQQAEVVKHHQERQRQQESLITK